MNTQTRSTTDFRRSIATATAGVVFSTFAALSIAGSYEPLEVTVNFADLDVSRPEGAIVLYHRIRSAAEQVCAPMEALGLGAALQLDACIDKAVANAVNTVNRPALFAVMSAKRKTSPTAPFASQSR
jgi:UrcA family protein